MSVFDGLPQAMFDVIPELKTFAPTREPRSTCSHCANACAPEDLPKKPYRFHPDIRCCTYHPALPNWAVGRAIRGGGLAEQKIRERIAHHRTGVKVYGLSAYKEWSPRKRFPDEMAFGRREELLCPYYVGGEQACGIYLYRDASCRTFHCKTDDGPRGQEYWLNLRSVIRAGGLLMAHRCVEELTAPEEDAPVEAMIDWYLRCAERIEHMTEEDRESIRDNEEMRSLVEEVVKSQTALKPPLPERLGASIKHVDFTPDFIELTGEELFDTIRAPTSIFQFIGRLDGNKPWKEVLAFANTLIGDAEPISEAFVENLYRWGILRAISGPESLAVSRRARIRNPDGSVQPVTLEQLLSEEE
ncbi:MAG: hypothetical protein AAFV53_29450 [Myxococcota bacterium]